MQNLFSKKEMIICFTVETLFFVGCALPAFAKCWDVYFLPKWYAGIITIFLVMTSFLFYPIRTKIILAQWKSVLPYSAGVSLLFLLYTVILDLYHNPFLLFEYGVGGTFGNPSCLAVTICLLYPISLIFRDDKSLFKREKIISVKYWNIGCTLITVFILICTHSRAGIIVFTFYVAMLLNRFFLSKAVWNNAIIIGVLTVSILCNLSSKLNSTKGRFFILERTSELILKKPFVGYGFGNFEKTYMEYQGEYFVQHKESKYAKLADNIKHPLNEFAKLWIENGIVAPVILLALIVIPLYNFRGNFAITMIEMCLLLFCFCSYPLLLPLPVILLICIPLYMFLTSIKSGVIIKKVVLTFTIPACLWLIGAFYIDNLMSSAKFYSLHYKHNRALLKYSKLDNFLSKPIVRLLYLSRYKVFTYDYTRELFTTSNFVKALQMMECTEKFITNYDTQLLKADIYYYMNEYDNSIESYKTASNMCPVKFAPLEGLLNCYNKQRNYIFERHLAKIILSKDIKVYSDEVERIRNKAYLVLQENIKVKYYK